VVGFFLLPAFSLLLEMCADIAGEDQAGSATSILMLAGNLGGVIIILLMAGADNDVDGMIAVLMVAGGLGFLGTVIAPETFKKVGLTTAHVADNDDSTRA
jgi:hypothetical protein